MALPLVSCAPSLRKQDIRFASAFKSPRAEAFGIAVFDMRGEIRFQTPLPERGHGAARHPKTNTIVSISRRPGTHLIGLDAQTGQIHHAIEAAAGRHFYGHAVFSAAGDAVFTTENAYDDGAGVIGVYEGDTLRRIGEFSAYGIGPHELILMPDNRTLAVAIGGIQTHPSAPRQNLNTATMRPALCFIDSRTGKLLRRWDIPAPDLHPLSIRHISVNANGQVAAAFQWEGDSAMTPPLVGICTAKEGWTLLKAPEKVQKAMRLYCGSVAFADDGRSFMVSSPRGNILTQWREDGTYMGTYTLKDGCGIAAAGQAFDFIASGGTGTIQTLAALMPAALPPVEAGLRWDNHLTRV